MRRKHVMAWMHGAARGTGQLDRPLRDFAEGAVADIGIWPGHVGFLALHRLVPSAPNGTVSLRTICEEVADGASVPGAFETAFGVSLEDFYADFENYRLELNPSGAPAPEDTTKSQPGLGPSNIKYDVAPNVPEDQVDVIKTGLQIAQDFLDSDLGGAIPEDARSEITVKIVSTGRGNEERGGDGACCTAFGETDGVSTMRPFFDVSHPGWTGGSLNLRKGTVAHEYTHIWQQHLGCMSKFHQPLGNWLDEGIAQYVGSEALIRTGDVGRAAVMDFMMRSARTGGQLDRPLRDFAEGAIRDIGIHPGHVGYLAVARLVLGQIRIDWDRGDGVCVWRLGR